MKLYDFPIAVDQPGDQVDFAMQSRHVAFKLGAVAGRQSQGKNQRPRNGIVIADVDRGAQISAAPTPMWNRDVGG